MKVISVLLLAMLVLGCGYSKPMASAPTPGAVPVVTQLVPNMAKAGDPGFTLTVNGTSFNSDAAINWNGSKQATTFVSGGQLTSMIPASAIAMMGNVTVTVTNPGHAAGGIYGSGGTMTEVSAPVTFTVN